MTFVTLVVDAVRVLLGLAFFLFIPGWLVVLIAFGELKGLEKTMLAVIVSIMVGLIIGVFFGYDRAQALWTGGFTPENIWMGEFAVTAFLGIVYVLKRTFMKQKKLPKMTHEHH